MRFLAFFSLALAVGCNAPDPGDLTIRAEAAEGAMRSIAPGELLGLVTVRRVNADRDALELPLEVTLSHDGDGELRGTLTGTITGGAVSFSDLSYAGCGSFVITATPDHPDIDPVRTGSIVVRPGLSLVEAPAQTIVDQSGPIGRIAVQLTGPGGAPAPMEGIVLRLTASAGVDLSGPVEATTDASGTASFVDVVASGEGMAQLRVTATDPTCPIPDLDAGILAVGEVVDLPTLSMPGGRVGVPYDARFSDDDDARLVGMIADGLTIEGGRLVGIPTAIGTYVSEAYRVTTEGQIERQRLRLAVFPNHDPELPEPLDPVAAGAFPVEVASLTLGPVTTAAGELTDTAVRVAYPSDGAGAVAVGPHPAVVFLPAATAAPATFDLYTELHDHWASHGFVVASVDSSALAAEPETLASLEDLSALAAEAARVLSAEAADTTSGFFEAVDLTQVYVAGHGRGGGGALLALRDDPTLAGAITLAPVLPELLAGIEGRADVLAMRPMPRRPVLALVGGADRVVAWPQAEILGETATGPYAIVTVHGANHLGALDEAAPHAPVSGASITRAERRAIERQYTTAFLHRFAFGELGFEASLFGRRGQTSALSTPGVSVRSRRRLNTEVPIFGAASPVTGSPLEVPLRDLGATLAELQLLAPSLLGAVFVDFSRAAYWDVSRLEQNVANRRRLLIDMQRECPPPPTDPMVADDTCPPVDVTVYVTMTDLSSAGSEIAIPMEMGEAAVVGRHWTTAILEMNDFDLDPGRLATLEVRVEAASEGVWVRDLRFE